MAQEQSRKTVTQAVGNDRKTGNDGKRLAISPGNAGPPGTNNVKSSLDAGFMGRSRNVLDAINTPSNRGARASTGHGAPLGLPRWGRAVSASGAAPSGARPTRGRGGSFNRPFNPPTMMHGDTVKKASGYNPRMHLPAHFGAKAAVVAAQSPHKSLYESAIGRGSPSFVRSSDGFRPPGTSEAQANVTPPQNAMKGNAMEMLKSKGPSGGFKSMAGKSSTFAPPNRRK